MLQIFIGKRRFQLYILMILQKGRNMDGAKRKLIKFAENMCIHIIDPKTSFSYIFFKFRSGIETQRERSREGGGAVFQHLRASVADPRTNSSE
jgi:hypothetical protein